MLERLVIQLLLSEEEEEGLMMPRPPQEAMWHGKRVWGGVASVLDGYIEHAVSYDYARSQFFHHTWFLRPVDVEGLNDGTHVFWFINEKGKISLDWNFTGPEPEDGKTADLATTIYRQLKW